MTGHGLLTRCRDPLGVRFATIGRCIWLARRLAIWRARRSAAAPPVFRSGTELVLVNVVVRDRSGASSAICRATTSRSPKTTSRRRSRASTSKSSIAPLRAAIRRSLRRSQSQTILVADRPDGAQGFSRAAGGEGRHARAAADRAVLRPELDAARRARARGQGGARLRRAASCPPPIWSRSPRSRRRCRSSRTSPPTADAAALTPSIAFGRQRRPASTTARPATSKARRTPATRSPPTTPSSTSSTPIAGSTRCRRWPTSSPASSRRSRSSTSAAA